MPNQAERRVSRTFIVLPALNEAETIGPLLDELLLSTDATIVLVNDASTDETASIAKQHGIVVIDLAVSLGAWTATQTGLIYALNNGAEHVVTMDADGQHLPDTVSAILRPVIEGRADVAIGSCRERGSGARQLAWHLMRYCSGLAVEDLTSGFRAYNRKAAERLVGWRATMLDHQDVGVLLALDAARLRVVDVPVAMRPRINGKSRIFASWMIVMQYMIHTLLLSLMKRRGNWRRHTK